MYVSIFLILVIVLLLVGEKDGTVSPGNSHRLAENLHHAGARVTLERFETLGHVDMVAKLAKPLRGDGLLLHSIVQFINQLANNVASQSGIQQSSRPDPTK